jgi:hypothetical protein
LKKVMVMALFQERENTHPFLGNIAWYSGLLFILSFYINRTATKLLMVHFEVHPSSAPY